MKGVGVGGRKREARGMNVSCVTVHSHVVHEVTMQSHDKVWRGGCKTLFDWLNSWAHIRRYLPVVRVLTYIIRKRKLVKKTTITLGLTKNQKERTVQFCR